MNATNALLSQLMEEAESFVRQGTSEPFTLEITVFMRYQGQGWEIPVPLPSRLMTEQDGEQIIMRFETCYREFFGRTIDVLDDLEIEIVNCPLRLYKSVSILHLFRYLYTARRAIKHNRQPFSTRVSHR